MGGRIDHPSLGTFEGGNWEWQGRDLLEVPSIGFTARHVSIVANSSIGKPNVDQLDALVALKELPLSFREELARGIFDAYRKQIRPQHLETCAELGDSCIFSKEDFPELKNPEEIWGLIRELEYVWVNEDASVNISFTVTFNPEDRLEVRLHEGCIVRVYME